MRPYFVLLLALALIHACSIVVLADSGRALETANGEHGRYLRAAETEVDDLSDNDEDRLLGYNTLQLWRMRRAAGKLMNSQLTTQQEAALRKWLAAKQDGFLTKWLQSSSVYPDQVYSKLGLTKLGERAKSSPNYKLYKQYTDALLQRWTNFQASPETVYKSLRLDKLGTAAKQSPSYPIYEKFLKLTQAKTSQLTPTQRLQKWLESSGTYPDKLYKELGIAGLSSDSADYKLYQRYVDALFERWSSFLPSPETVYKSLRLDTLGANAAKSPSYPIYEKYLKRFLNQPAH
ncbi:putative secreted RxLR effector protein [Phytophthora cinnamomi]|uniref:putative secreted RxLR effector protein n=1 Tax=Phytophthora cinnamomi TaxID=4785 RepID=UPI00355A2857|nr:putative secreted RxLR effector protein [Phytophthora cinnamomi]